MISAIGGVLAALVMQGATPPQTPDSQLPCTKVPGVSLAATLGGRVTNTISSGWVGPGEARCRYYLRAPDADTTSRIYMLYIQPDSDYDGLKENTSEPTR